MPERINIKVGAIGSSYSQQSKNILTLQQVISWIESHYQDPEKRARLIQKAHEYPRGAMTQFLQNIKKYNL